MKNNFFSYLDGFNLITIIVPNKTNQLNKSFKLEAENVSIPLRIIQTYALGDETKYICEVNETIFLNESYIVIDESNNRSFLRIGKVVRTELFDMMFEYDNHDLGITYTKEHTIFKVWSPVAKEIELELIREDGSRQFIDLLYQTSGLWQVIVYENLDKVKYRYRVRVNERFKSALDPFAIASTANGKYNVVVDSNKFRKFKYEKPAFTGRKVDAIIYEASVRDLTMSPTSKAKEKGKFIGLLEGHQEEGIDYISSLGVTHLQLLPIYDFEGVDELNPYKYYNWGYNPSQYNVVEGSFSTNPNDPYKRIDELIEFVDYCHYKGLRISMDVVYNHVYNMQTFAFEKFVPGYFFRYDDRGIRTNASGCGNDVASERSMVRHFIIQSVKYWMNTFKISAFRFDLMGLLDIETMSRAETESKLIDPHAFLYGEGWQMDALIPFHHRANMRNAMLMPNIAFFNDKFRELIKGGTFTNSLGFSMGGVAKRSDLYYLFTGSAIDRYLFINPSQSLNYVECHDNHTYYDRAKMLLKDASDDVIKDYSRLALSLVILSQGIPFIHAGQCFLRTKKGDENSYKSSDEINAIDWDLKEKHIDLVNTVKDLIKLRKTYKVFRLDTNALIKKQVKIATDKPYDKTIQLKLDDLTKTLIIYFKNDYQNELLTPGPEYKLLFDSLSIVNGEKKELLVSKPGAYIFIKE